jgi:hypothetical protein
MPFNVGDRVRRVRGARFPVMDPNTVYVVRRVDQRPDRQYLYFEHTGGTVWFAENFDLAEPEIEDRFVIFCKRPDQTAAFSWTITQMNRQQAENAASDSSRIRGREDWVFYLVPVRAVAAYQNGNLLTD